MRKGLTFFAVFAASVIFTMVYQSCGDSSIQSNPSSNGGLQVEPGNPPPAPTPGGDGTGGDGTGGDGTGGDGTGGDGTGGDGTGGVGPFAFNLGNGDNILFVDDAGADSELGMSMVYTKLYYTMADTTIYYTDATAPTDDLPTNYCANSAFPHCRTYNGSNCTDFGCFNVNQVVRCNSQSRMNSATITNTFAIINATQFLNRVATPDDPVTPNCNNPKMFFNAETQSLEISLADRSCVPDGKYYATGGGSDVINIFSNYLSNVNGAGVFCNNYSLYAWNTTKFAYLSSPGYTTQQLAQWRAVNYENALVSLRFKDSGDTTEYCATNVYINPPGLDVFFPASGVNYKMVHTGVAVADAPTAQITYEDPVDGGATRTFFMNDISATTNRGGAVIEAAQAQAMRDHVEVLVNRAKSLNMAQPCPTP